MTAALATDAPPSLFDAEGDDGGATLQDVVLDAWRALATQGAASCPVCAGTLEPRFGAGAAPVAARCRNCGAELS